MMSFSRVCMVGGFLMVALFVLLGSFLMMG
jgi:hypothetical protein